MNPPMKISASGLGFLKTLESCKLAAYWDVSGWAIGYGHHGPEIGRTTIWSQTACDSVLFFDTAKVSYSLSTLIKVSVTQGQFDALVSFAYNVGVSAFASSTLLERLNDSEYSYIPYELSRWVYSDHQVDSNLVSRRAAEAEVWKNATPVSTETQNQTSQQTSKG